MALQEPNDAQRLLRIIAMAFVALSGAGCHSLNRGTLGSGGVGGFCHSVGLKDSSSNALAAATYTETNWGIIDHGHLGMPMPVIDETYELPATDGTDPVLGNPSMSKQALPSAVRPVRQVGTGLREDFNSAASERTMGRSGLADLPVDPEDAAIANEVASIESPTFDDLPPPSRPMVAMASTDQSLSPTVDDVTLTGHEAADLPSAVIAQALQIAGSIQQERSRGLVQPSSVAGSPDPTIDAVYDDGPSVLTNVPSPR